MSSGRAGVQRRRRWGSLALVTVLAGVTALSSADARSRHHRSHHHHTRHTVSSYNPPYASIVVDANSGKVMQATNADSPRHPASLTKMMTLYLLFERLAAGQMKMTTEMPVSAHAAAMAPTKLGLKPGEHLTVSDAIQGIVTQSANDAAVVVAEAIGGTETEFAREMTAKARALGMMHTNYHNASGLPDEAQITTARDESILARALQDRFPQYFHYFSLRAFVYHGRRMRNHNHLLGRIDGVDGMKTGYIHESGFNIVTDVHRHGRHLIVVVFGGRSARVRDAQVVNLIDRHIKEAALKRSAPMIAEGRQHGLARAKTGHEERVAKVASATPLPPRPPAVAAAAPAPAPGSTAPIKAIPVKTVVVQQPPVMHTASLAPLPTDSRKLRPAPATANPAKITTVAVHHPPPPPKPAEPAANQVATAGASGPVPHVVEQESAAKPRGGWMIQVGAFDVEKDAKERLTLCQSKAKSQLAAAASFTEPVAKDGKTLYRARFAGLGKAQAETACKHLKRSDIPCMLLRN
jgi:D-alanyl-D-alanine carboxypeptidase